MYQGLEHCRTQLRTKETESIKESADEDDNQDFDGPQVEKTIEVLI